MRNMALGRYVPYDTPLHRMDPRIKIVGLIVFMVAIFLSFGHTSTNFAVYGLIFVLVVTMMVVGKVSFLSILKTLKALWFMVLFLFVINVFLTTSGDVAFSIGKLQIYWDGIFNTLYVFLRLIMMIMITTVLTATTKPLELTFGLEWLLSPLKYIRVPVSSVAMTLSLALRFIPTLTEETDRIMMAQASRGVDFRNGKIKEKVRSIVALIVPLFMSALTRSGELADAMESRGYDPARKRTKYRSFKWSLRDTVSVLLLSVFLSGIITLAVLKFDIVATFEALIK